MMSLSDARKTEVRSLPFWWNTAPQSRPQCLRNLAVMRRRALGSRLTPLKNAKVHFQLTCVAQKRLCLNSLCLRRLSPSGEGIVIFLN